MSRLIVWIAAVMLSITATASELPETSGASGDLGLCARVELKAAFVFEVGTAGLYLRRCADHDRLLESVPKQFSLLLARDFEGADLIRSAENLLVENLPAENAGELPDSLRCLARAYVDAAAGDRYDVRYRPDSGLSLHLNGEALATCPRDDRDHLYFSIWFGERPFNERMKAALIERAKRSAGATASAAVPGGPDDG